MEPIIGQQLKYYKDCKFSSAQKHVCAANSLSFRAGPHSAFTVPNLIPALATNGFALIPGLTDWYDLLSPLNHREAWEALADKNIAEIIRMHPKQQRRFFLNDSSELDNDPQLSVNFVRKDAKSHLTIVQGAEAVGECPTLPTAVRSYLKSGNEFIKHIRDVLIDVLPTPTLPTILKVRIFEYHPSDPLAGLRPFIQREEAMKPHVDGSIVTFVIAQSDGLLLFAHQGQWYSAVRADKKPFAVVIPGVAAAHDYGILPTPHMVLTGTERRASVTVFFTPELSTMREAAERQARRWCSQENSVDIHIAA
jgi:hypothetical protein